MSSAVIATSVAALSSMSVPMVSTVPTSEVVPPTFLIENFRIYSAHDEPSDLMPEIVAVPINFLPDGIVSRVDEPSNIIVVAVASVVLILNMKLAD